MYSDVAYVVFGDDSGHWWSRWLHPSIRHCYVVKPDCGRWLRFARTHESYELYTESELCRNHTIMLKWQMKPCKRGLFMLNTCVGHTKQALGINAWWVLTPYQLYRYMRVRQ